MPPKSKPKPGKNKPKRKLAVPAQAPASVSALKPTALLAPPSGRASAHSPTPHSEQPTTSSPARSPPRSPRRPSSRSPTRSPRPALTAPDAIVDCRINVALNQRSIDETPAPPFFERVEINGSTAKVQVLAGGHKSYQNQADRFFEPTIEEFLSGKSACIIGCGESKAGTSTALGVALKREPKCALTKVLATLARDVVQLLPHTKCKVKVKAQFYYENGDIYFNKALSLSSAKKDSLVGFIGTARGALQRSSTHHMVLVVTVMKENEKGELVEEPGSLTLIDLKGPAGVGLLERSLDKVDSANPQLVIRLHNEIWRSSRVAVLGSVHGLGNSRDVIVRVLARTELTGEIKPVDNTLSTIPEVDDSGAMPHVPPARARARSAASRGAAAFSEPTAERETPRTTVRDVDFLKFLADTESLLYDAPEQPAEPAEGSAERPTEEPAEEPVEESSDNAASSSADESPAESVSETLVDSVEREPAPGAPVDAVFEPEAIGQAVELALAYTPEDSFENRSIDDSLHFEPESVPEPQALHEHETAPGAELESDLETNLELPHENEQPALDSQSSAQSTFQELTREAAPEFNSEPETPNDTVGELAVGDHLEPQEVTAVEHQESALIESSTPEVASPDITSSEAPEDLITPASSQAHSEPSTESEPTTADEPKLCTSSQDHDTAAAQGSSSGDASEAADPNVQELAAVQNFEPSVLDAEIAAQEQPQSSRIEYAEGNLTFEQTAGLELDTTLAGAATTDTSIAPHEQGEQDLFPGAIDVNDSYCDEESEAYTPLETGNSSFEYVESFSASKDAPSPQAPALHESEETPRRSRRVEAGFWGDTPTSVFYDVVDPGAPIPIDFGPAKEVQEVQTEQTAPVELDVTASSELAKETEVVEPEQRTAREPAEPTGEPEALVEETVGPAAGTGEVQASLAREFSPVSPAEPVFEVADKPRDGPHAAPGELVPTEAKPAEDAWALEFARAANSDRDSDDEYLAELDRHVQARAQAQA